jgi:hypothetical protein
MCDAPDEEIVRRQLDTEREEPVVTIAELVAELEGVRHDELKTTYEHSDHILGEIFATPPVPEAQVEITFTYEGYRITVEQDGSAQFVEV